MKKISFLAMSMVFVLTCFSALKAEAYASLTTPFEDLNESDYHWATDEIVYLSKLGIINGYSDRTFRPNNKVTRSQAIGMTVRALNLNVTNRPNPGFKDVKPGDSFYKEIAAAVDEGLYPKGSMLYPNQAVTREVMARLISQGFKLQGGSATLFKDVPKSYWAYSYIDKLAKNSITTGYADNTFRPKNTVTRGQFSVFLARSLSSDYKLYTYSNQLGYKLELPNYMKRKVVVENGGCMESGVHCTNFYYKDNSLFYEDVWVYTVYRVAKKDWLFYEGFLPKLKEKNGYVYASVASGEHPYYGYNSKEFAEWSMIHNRIENAVANMK